MAKCMACGKEVYGPEPKDVDDISSKYKICEGCKTTKFVCLVFGEGTYEEKDEDEDEEEYREKVFTNENSTFKAYYYCHSLYINLYDKTTKEEPYHEVKQSYHKVKKEVFTSNYYAYYVNCVIVEDYELQFIPGWFTKEYPNLETVCNGLADYGYNNFQGCINYDDELYIHGELITVGDNTFNRCGSKKVIIGRNVIRLENCLHDCQNLETIHFENEMLKDSDMYFVNCPNIKTLIFDSKDEDFIKDVSGKIKKNSNSLHDIKIYKEEKILFEMI